MAHRTLTLAVGSSLAAAVVACSSGVGTERATAPATAVNAVETQVSQDVASVLANEVGATVADYQQTEADIGLAGSLPPGVVQPSGACPTDSIGRTRTFPSTDPRDTISYARTWQFFSQAGCERHYVADSTNVIAATSVFKGDFNDDDHDWAGRHAGARVDTVTGTRMPGTDLVLSKAPTHVWSGNAMTFDSISFKGAHEQRMHRWLAYDTTSNVSLATGVSGPCNYPLSGTWTRWLSDTLDVTGDQTVSKEIRLRLVLTFTTSSPGVGSKFATLQMYNLSQMGAPETTCMVDLWTGTIVGGSCH